MDIQTWISLIGAWGKNVPISWDEYFLILSDQTRRRREKTFNPGSGTVSIKFQLCFGI
jgi:hypothetical protein